MPNTAYGAGCGRASGRGLVLKVIAVEDIPVAARMSRCRHTKILRVVALRRDDRGVPRVAKDHVRIPVAPETIIQPALHTVGIGPKEHSRPTRQATDDRSMESNLLHLPIQGSPCLPSQLVIVVRRPSIRNVLRSRPNRGCNPSCNPAAIHHSEVVVR